jgi:hypothetical protein
MAAAAAEAGEEEEGDMEGWPSHELSEQRMR